MTMAELHGKILFNGPGFSGPAEDLLISDLFSACRYSPPNTLLRSILENANNKKRESLCVSAIEHVYYHFWPRSELNNREADVLFDITHKKGEKSLIIIEGKYRRGAADTTDSEDRRRDEVVRLAEVHAMLDEPSRHFPWLGNTAFVNRRLILIDTGKSYPKRLFRSAKVDDSYWINWKQILTVAERVFEQNISPVLEDLILLLKKKGMK